MSASSSRIMIAPVDGSRPLSDRFIDRLLGWWDVGGGRTMRRALRGAVGASKTKIRTVTAPVMERPLVAKAVARTAAGLAVIRRWLGKAFSTDVPAAATQREEIRATVVTEVEDAPAPVRPAVVTRSGTAEIRTPTKSGTAEIRPRTAPSITQPVIAAVPTTKQKTSTLTNLRCWSCLQRTGVRSPRRGGCFLCAGCNTAMLVVDPIVGLTCEVAQGSARGIQLNRQADETDPG
jgi:hypothetical protein